VEQVEMKVAQVEKELGGFAFIRDYFEKMFTWVFILKQNGASKLDKLKNK
jgi:hypothetical protein